MALGTRANPSLCAEPLECRRLLSAAAPAAPAAASQQSNSVVVVEFAPADETEDDISLTPEQVPKRVADALSARFPGAKMNQAWLSSDEGPEFEITADYQHQQIDVVFSPGGAL